MRPIENLADIRIFTCIAAAGSLSAAARELGLSLAAVSKRLGRLEENLGVRLVNRTTRRLSLTEEGADFHARCVKLLADFEEAQDAVASHRREASGLLRVTTTAAFARRQIAPRLALFHQHHPGVRVQVVVTDMVLDLVQNGIDLAIRQAELPDSSLIVRELAPNRRVVCAAPAYLDRHGRPRTPQDLLRHACIVLGDPPMSNWHFESVGGEPLSVAIDGRIITNDGEVAHAAALAGAGIMLKSVWDVAEDIGAGRLEALLPDYRSPAPPIQAVYPSTRHMAAKLRVFIDFLVREFGAAHSI